MLNGMAKNSGNRRITWERRSIFQRTFEDEGENPLEKMKVQKLKGRCQLKLIDNEN